MTITTTKTVRLGDLAHDPVIMAMPGQEARLKELDDLKASIAAQGLLQGLKVRVDADGIRYLVTAGNRRLATLRWLRDNGGEVRGERVTDEWQVPVIHSEETDATAREQAVAENVQRVALTPGAEALQYAELAKTASNKEIAARFGVPEKRVAQRLKLAALHPEVLDALDAGKISIKAAEAFTLEPDPGRQAKYLRESLKSKPWQLNPEQVRRAFQEVLVAADGPLAKLIGKDKYKAAGGVVTTDPFGSGGYWTSRDVVEKLVAEHWAERIAKWKAEGWGFIAEAGEFDQYYFNIERFPKKPNAEERKGLGVIYWRDGTREPMTAVIDAKRVKPPKRPKVSVPEKPKGTLDMPGPSTLHTLSSLVNKAVQEKVSQSPDLALRVCVAALHASVYHYGSPVKISTSENRQLDKPPEGIGREFVSALVWATAQSTESLLAHLATLVAPAIDLREVNGSRMTASKCVLRDVVVPDLAPHFDAEAFFSGITKELIALAYEEITGHPGETLGLGRKKAEIVKEMAERARDTGWLPPQMRTIGYAGPGPAPAVPVATEASGDDLDDDDDDDDGDDFDEGNDDLGDDEVPAEAAE